MKERLSWWPGIFGLALAMILVTVIQPVTSSLAYAGIILVVIAVLGWALEAREIAGPPSTQAQDNEIEQAGPSFWPVVLAIGFVGIAAGLVYRWEYGALIVAVPLAVGAGLSWLARLRRELAVEREKAAVDVLIEPNGRALYPVSNQVLRQRSESGVAIAKEHIENHQISRRGLLRVTFWTGLVAGLAAFGGTLVDFVYPRGVTGFGAVISAGPVSNFPPGSKTQIVSGHFWLVNLTDAEAKRSDPETGKAGFLALWWRCPHLGCTVPWRPDFTFNGRSGWFRCPCHGSTYDDAGKRVYGPAPHGMDPMTVTIEAGQISVDTGSIGKGSPRNASMTVQA